jgi:hypothetical protein
LFGGQLLCSMIRKSGYRFSEKIMLIKVSGTAKTNGARFFPRRVEADL